MSRFPFLCMSVLIALGPARYGGIEAQGAPPNVVLVTTDDLG